MKHTTKNIAIRLSTLCVATAIAASSIVAPVSAATTTKEQKVSGKSYFKREWEYTVTYRFKPDNKVLGKMVYGYDTDWINEDYVWSQGSECAVQGYIWRVGSDSAWQSDGKSKGSGKWSKTEIRHRSIEVKYKTVFDASYGSNFLEGNPVESYEKG